MNSLNKTHLCLISLLFICMQCEDPFDPGDPIDIADNAFMDALIEDGYDKDGDGIISYEEAESVTSLFVFGGKNITSLKGIEAFINLESLHICRTSIRRLHLPGLGNLTSLWCRDNELLSDLDFSECVSLTGIACENNALTSIDLSGNPELESLYCFSN